MNKFPVIENSKDFETHFQSDVWREAAVQICLSLGISYGELRRAASSDHVVFLVDDKLVLKIYRPFRQCFEREIKALEFVGGKTDFGTPEIIAVGEFENFRCAVTTQLPGVAVTRAEWLKLSQKTQIEFISALAANLKQLHSLDASSFVSDWAEFVTDRAATFVERQINHGVNKKVIAALPAFIEENLKLVPQDEPTIFMHSDIHFGNLRVSETGAGKWQISGLFDFADSRRGFREYEFLAVGLLMMQGQREIQREFFKSYGYTESELDETLRKRLMMLTMLYETADLRRYAMRLKPEAVDYTLNELERGIWAFAD